VITAGLGLPGLAVMIAFFVVGTAVTKLGYRVKAQRGIAQEKGGARGWRNAWANGGVPAALALLAGLSAPDDRHLFALAYAAAVATAAADTCSSEVGKAYGRRTFLITTLRPVPPGTGSAISAEGTFAGLVGATIVAVVGAARSSTGRRPWCWSRSRACWAAWPRACSARWRRSAAGWTTTCSTPSTPRSGPAWPS
jgi:uncharacterized protein (TIGR00297 family)